MHHRKKNLIVSLFVIAVVFTALHITIHSPRFHSYLLSILKRGSGWEITIEDSKVSLMRGVLILYGLKVSDPNGRAQIAAERITLNTGILSLVRGRLIVEEMVVVHPQVFVKTAEKTEKPDWGKISQTLRRLFSRFEQSFFLQNSILDRVTIHDLEIHLSNGKSFFLSKTLLHVEPNIFRQIELDAELADATGLMPTIRSLLVKATFKKEGVKLRELNLALEKINLRLNGEWTGDVMQGELALGGGLEAPTVLSDPLRFSIKSKLNKKIAAIQSLKASLGAAMLEGSGSFDIDELRYNIPFKARELPLETIFQKLPSPVLGPAKGMAEVDGRAEGALPAIIVTAQAKIRDFKHTVLAAREATGPVNLKWPSLDFDATVRPGSDGRVQARVTGQVTFKKTPEERKLTVFLDNLDLKLDHASTQDIVPSLNVSGTMNGTLRMDSSREGFVQGTGHAELSEARWFLGDIKSLVSDIVIHPQGLLSFTKTTLQLPDVPALWLPNELKMNVSGETVAFNGQPAPWVTVKGVYLKDARILKVESLLLKKDLTSLTGSFNVAPEAKVEGKLKGDLDLDWLAYYPPLFREGRGIGRLDVAFSGPLKDPSFRGKIEFPEGSDNEVSVRGFPAELTRLQGTLTVNGDSFMPKLQGLLGDGDFQLEGRLKLPHWKPEEVDLDLHGRNLTLSQPNVYRLDFNADVSLKGRFPSPVLEGRIDIVDGRYIKPFVVRELVIHPQTIPSEPAPWEKELDRLQLRLDIRNSGDLKIKNNVADLLLQSDLKVSGTYGQPKIVGALTATEGTFHYFGQDFVLTEARLEYRSSVRDEPYLTLLANQAIPPDYTISVEVTGFLSNLEVHLTSSPSLPREDIISLIAVGVTQEELRTGSRSRRYLGREILASEISGVLERPVSRSVGLDIFRLEASRSGTLSLLSLGKNVTDRLSFEFRSDLAPETAERTFQANYYLTDNILLKGYRTRLAGTNPRYQFNVSFRFRLN